jgi:hypothetical protein
MREIAFVDLRAQYRGIKPAIDAAVERVLERQCFVDGPGDGGLRRGVRELLRGRVRGCRLPTARRLSS